MSEYYFVSLTTRQVNLITALAGEPTWEINPTGIKGLFKMTLNEQSGADLLNALSDTYESADHEKAEYWDYRELYDFVLARIRKQMEAQIED